jgi:hypothetical protein
VRQLESCRHLQALFCVDPIGRPAYLLPLCHPPRLWCRTSGLASNAGPRSVTPAQKGAWKT